MMINYPDRRKYSSAQTPTEKPKKSKYGAVKTEVDGIMFDSKREASRYQELRLLEQAGEIANLRNIREMLRDEILYIWNGVYRQHAGYRKHTTKEIDTKLREMLKSELERKEKEFAEL